MNAAPLPSLAHVALLPVGGAMRRIMPGPRVRRPGRQPVARERCASVSDGNGACAASWTVWAPSAAHAPCDAESRRDRAQGRQSCHDAHWFVLIAARSGPSATTAASECAPLREGRRADTVAIARGADVRH
jgi:hypothetical protein